jgi:hypothetical protein
MMAPVARAAMVATTMGMFLVLDMVVDGRICGVWVWTVVWCEWERRMKEDERLRWAITCLSRG